jgi:hypothetical protein
MSRSGLNWWLWPWRGLHFANGHGFGGNIDFPGFIVLIRVAEFHLTTTTPIHTGICILVDAVVCKNGQQRAVKAPRGECIMRASLIVAQRRSSGALRTLCEPICLSGGASISALTQPAHWGRILRIFRLCSLVSFSPWAVAHVVTGKAVTKLSRIRKLNCTQTAPEKEHRTSPRRPQMRGVNGT